MFGALEKKREKKGKERKSNEKKREKKEKERKSNKQRHRVDILARFSNPHKSGRGVGGRGKMPRWSKFRLL